MENNERKYFIADCIDGVYEIDEPAELHQVDHYPVYHELDKELQRVQKGKFLIFSCTPEVECEMAENYAVNYR